MTEDLNLPENAPVTIINEQTKPAPEPIPATDIPESQMPEPELQPATPASDSPEPQQSGSAPYSFWAEQVAKENSYPRNYSYINGAIPADPVKKPKKGTFHKFLKKTASALLFGVVAAVVFIGIQHVYYACFPDARPVLTTPDANKTIPTLASTPLTNVEVAEDSLVSKLIEQVEPSVVTIASTFTTSYSWFGQQFSQSEVGGGSGIIVGKNDAELLIATNCHVVEDATTIKVTFSDGNIGSATIKGKDSVADLAILSVPLDKLSETTRSTIKIAALGDSAEVKVGEMVIAIGNALGYGQSVTVGYISAKDRSVKIDGNTMILLQTDAAINPGNSGGALLNTRGEVIGINSVKYAANEVEGIGFAIPISNAYPILDEFMNRETLTEEEKGYLGITIQTVTEELLALGFPSGVMVASLSDDSPAKEAGILPYDVITKINGYTVSTNTQLKERVNSLRVGTEVTVTLQRRNSDGKFAEHEFKVVLAQNPELQSER